MAWVLINLAFYTLIFHYTPAIGAGTGWEKYQFFLFLATGLLINSLVQALFMTNADEFSELVRTGRLDFALLKPIDTQFLVSLVADRLVVAGQFCRRAGADGLCAVPAGLHAGPGRVAALPAVRRLRRGDLLQPDDRPGGHERLAGRNQTLFDFWFYITNFSRYPMEIYHGPWGTPLRRVFTFCIPVLVAVNVPARILVRPLQPQSAGRLVPARLCPRGHGGQPGGSRWVFQRALWSYRSASS